MISGTFDVAIDSPKVHKRGTAALKGDGDGLTALLKFADADFADVVFTGTCDGTQIELAGETDLYGIGLYRATGEVWGNSLDVKAETALGKVTVYGTRLSGSAGDLKSSHEYLMRASTGEFGSDDNTMFAGRFADGG